MHGEQAIIELIVAPLWNLIAVLMLAFVALGVIAFGVITGAVVSPVFKKQRHLFWFLPLLNVALCLVMGVAAESWSGGTSPVEQPRIPYGLALILGSVAALLGWVSAALLVPLRMAWRWTTAGEELSASEKRLWDAWLARPAASNLFGGIVDGLAAPWHGLGYLARHPRLWRYALAPLLLNLLLTACMLIVFLAAAAGLAHWLHGRFPPGWSWFVLELLCWLALALVALAATLAVWLVLLAVLCSYFHENLARQVELQLGLPEQEIKTLTSAQQIADAWPDLASLALASSALLVMQLVPVVGAVIGLPLGFAYNSYLLGAQFLDYPLSLRGWRRREKRRFTRHFRAQAVGLGGVVFVVLLVPVLGSVLIVTAVVGAVLLQRRLALIGTAAPAELRESAHSRFTQSTIY